MGRNLNRRFNPRGTVYHLDPYGDNVLLNINSIRIQSIVTNGIREETSYFKVGDSNTQNTFFMRSFHDNIGDYALHTFAGLQSSLDWFRFAHGLYGPAALSTTRAGYVLGLEDVNQQPLIPPADPSPLEQSIASQGGSPGGRYATIMYGTNGDTSLVDFDTHMRTIVADCVAVGIIPILNTIPACPACSSGGPCDDSPGKNSCFNDVIRVISDDQVIPLIDVRLLTDILPSLGLSDGKHLSAVGNGCDLSSSGMIGGFNVRNMLTLKMLRLVRAARLEVPPE